MTLMDAPQPDLARERRRKIMVAALVVLVLLLASLAWMYRYWPEERVADKFFEALQKQDYPTAYGIYHPDPAKYPYNEFYRDWGPGGEWGLIKTYKIEASGTCPGSSGGGVVVQVIVNDRAKRARVWVQKSDKTLTDPPC